MARIRSIKPELPQDAKLARVSRNARLTFIYLLTQVDDAGYFRASSRLLVGQLYPHDADVTEALLECWLDELVKIGRVVLFDSEDGPIGQLVNFLKHQRIDHPTKSYLASLSRTIREPLASRVLSPESRVLSPEQKENPPIGGQKKDEPKLVATKRRGVSLPEGWEPNRKHNQIAADCRVDCAVEAEHFRDWALAKGQVFRDWDAGFRNWLRNAKKFNGNRPPAGSDAAKYHNEYPGRGRNGSSSPSPVGDVIAIGTISPNGERRWSGSRWEHV